jgi:sodium/hydrogen exchanger-like protein 6/7
MAQLMENFIFIYLGLSLFTERVLEYKPLFILVTVIGICVARWCAVFPLTALINWFIRTRARRRGQENVAEEIPQNWKIMLFWAGLRGAVGVALAAGLTGPNGNALRATVLVVVVLTVIIFGGTTARMLEILKIRTGVVEEIDSDDEFDIEPVPNGAGGAFARKNGSAFGHMPKNSGNGSIGLGDVGGRTRTATYSSGNHGGAGASNWVPELERRNSSRMRRDRENAAERGLLSRGDDEEQLTDYDDELQLTGDNDDDDLGLPPAAARRSPAQRTGADGTVYPISGQRAGAESHSNYATQAALTARGAISQILNATSEDAGTLFNKLDENFLKPHLLLDPGHGSDSHGHGSRRDDREER